MHESRGKVASSAAYWHAGDVRTGRIHRRRIALVGLVFTTQADHAPRAELTAAHPSTPNRSMHGSSPGNSGRMAIDTGSAASPPASTHCVSWLAAVNAALEGCCVLAFDRRKQLKLAAAAAAALFVAAHRDDSVSTHQLGGQHSEQPDGPVADDGDRLAGADFGGFGSEPAGAERVGAGQQAGDQVRVWRGRGFG